MQIRIRSLFRAVFETIHRAAHTFAPLIEDMGIYHSGFDILVAQEFLYSSDIVSVLQQVRGEGMPKRVARCTLADSGPPDGGLHCLLDQRLVHMMSALLA
jgi:hypothetical protein